MGNARRGWVFILAGIAAIGAGFVMAVMGLLNPADATHFAGGSRPVLGMMTAVCGVVVAAIGFALRHERAPRRPDRREAPPGP